MNKWVFILVCIVAMGSIGCNSYVYYSSKRDNNLPKVSNLEDEIRTRIVQESYRYLGKPYCFGGNAQCFDCSGLTQKVYRAVGIKLPRTAEEQSKLGSEVALGELKIGDLLFFGNGREISHVGIYVGDGAVIHSSTSRGVVQDKINKLQLSFKFAKRLLE